MHPALGADLAVGGTARARGVPRAGSGWAALGWAALALACCCVACRALWACSGGVAQRATIQPSGAVRLARGAAVEKIEKMACAVHSAASGRWPLEGRTRKKFTSFSDGEINEGEFKNHVINGKGKISRKSNVHIF